MTHNEHIQEIIHNIEKSESDQREYRGLILKNQLKVLLISDKKAFKSAVSLSVGVGSLSEPSELPGLAHFLEHMLFMGSKKYPGENEYRKFITDHGGYDNAYTADDSTNYHYDIDPESLKQSLDMLAQFFIDPLFDKGSAEREVKAVNSEHDGCVSNDYHRFYRVLQTTSDPAHPYSRFSEGNLTTLWTRPLEQNIDVRSALIKFHEDYYSSNIMTLAVLGIEPLDELCNLVTEIFHPIVNKNVALPTWTQPFSENQLQTIVYDVPNKDLRNLTLVFQIPDDRLKFYKTGSVEYLSHLLAHEGKGSLLALLKSKNWVTDLEVEIDEAARGFSLFFIYFKLTVSGLQYMARIILHVFQYFHMLKEFGPLEWIWEELKAIKAIKFRFRDKQDPINYVTVLSSKMLVYPLVHAISAGRIFTTFHPNRINELLKYFTPSNLRCLVTKKDNASEENLTEEYYGIKYSISRIDEKLIKEWTKCFINDSLKLPPVNEFIPTNFDLKPSNDMGIKPKVIAATIFSRKVWFLQDNEFVLPKAVIYVSFFRGLPLKSPLNTALNHMFIVTLDDSLSEFAYAPALAGMPFWLLETVYGLRVWCGGYNHKLHILLEHVLYKIIHYSVNENRFAVLKEAYQRGLQNWEKSELSSRASWYLTCLLRREAWTQSQLIDVLPDVTPRKLLEYAKCFISKLSLEWLFHGNLVEDDAMQVVQKFENMLRNHGSVPLPASACVLIKELKLEEGDDYVYRKSCNFHSDSCTMVYYQCGLCSTRKVVLLELLHQIISEPCFDTLRTKEELGYHVYSQIRTSNVTQGLLIYVQSKRYQDFLECRIDNFLESFYDTLVNMSDEEFLDHRNSLKSVKSEKPETLWEKAAEMWNEIVFRQFNFDRQNIELKELETITKSDIITYFSDLIGTKCPSKSRKRLAIQMISTKSSDENQQLKSGCPCCCSPTISKDLIVPGTEEDINTNSKTKCKRVGVQIDNEAKWKINHNSYEIPKGEQIEE